MKCQETRELLNAFIDDALESGERVTVQQHIVTCADCSAAVAALRTLSEDVQQARRYEAPATLHTQVNAALTTLAENERDARRLTLRGARAWWSLVAAGVVGAVLSGLWMQSFSTQLTVAQVELRDVVTAHVRSLMTDATTQVASDDGHTIKPWFNGKIDFAFPVKDYAEEAYELQGARLDYVQEDMGAVLIYKRREHVISVFIYPKAGNAPFAPAAQIYNGFNVFNWQREGLTYWIVSDLNAKEIEEFARLFRQEEPIV